MLKTFDPLNCSVKTETKFGKLNYNQFEGVPSSAAFNLCLLMIFCIIFSILRKSLWDYGRLALVARKDLKPPKKIVGSQYNVWNTLYFTLNNKYEPEPENEDKQTRPTIDTQTLKDDLKFFNWITATFKLRDADIFAKCGEDAIQFLSFQRHLIVAMAITMVLNMAVLFPINHHFGNIEANKFSQFTISNIGPKSYILAVHCGIAWLNIVLVILVMLHFAANLPDRQDKEMYRTVMIQTIPEDQRSAEAIKPHFIEAYSALEVEEINFAADVSKLANLQLSQLAALDGLNASLDMEKKEGVRKKMLPYTFGQLCCCPCCVKLGFKEVDCIDYYTEMADNFKKQCDEEKNIVKDSVLGVVFVTFKDRKMAESFVKKNRSWCGVSWRPTSSIAKQINSNSWTVKMAPAPENVLWQNLSTPKWVWIIRWCIVNILTLSFIFFITTPSFVIQLFTKFSDYIFLHKNINLENLVNKDSKLGNMGEAILSMSVGIMLPILVEMTDSKFIKHRTKSDLHLGVMRKIYLVLISMQFLLPSFGLSSLSTLVDWIFQKSSESYQFRWNCVFMPKNSAYFVHFVIAGATMGVGMDLLRFPELSIFMLNMSFAKSTAERKIIRQNLIKDFLFGHVYAFELSIFTVAMAYSIMCPLITVPGFCYVCFKHFVDRHNIYFVNKPSKIDPAVHATAVNFVLIAAFIQLLFLVIFIVLQSEEVYAMFLYFVIGQFVVIYFVLYKLSKNWFSEENISFEKK